MATIDPSIALGVKQIELPNQLGQFAQAAQIQHYQQQNALANRTMEQEDALNKAYAASVNKSTGEIDPNMLRQNVIGANLGSKLPAVEKTILESRELKAKVSKSEFENKKAQYENSITDILRFDNHDQIIGALGAKVKAGELTDAQAQQLAATVPQDPRMIPAWQIKTARSILSAKDQLEQHFQQQDTGGGTRVLSMPKYGGGPAQVVQGSQATKTMTPGEASAARAVTYQTDADGNIVALPTRVEPGAAPKAAAVIAPGAGMQPLKAKDASKTAVSEQQASYNIGRVLNAAKEIGKIAQKDPSVIQPSMGEAAAGAVGATGVANAARSANRQIVYGAQRDALDALLYLATGAAYNKEQLDGQMAAYIPAYTDKPEAVAAKQVRMAELIQSAKTRAGKAWTPAMEDAMKSLTNPAAAASDVDTSNPLLGGKP